MAHLQPRSISMLHPEEMLAKASRCEEMAERAGGQAMRQFLREAAQHWRAMAALLGLLEREAVYRIIRHRE